MHLILLPGNSPENKLWIQDVEKVLAPMFQSTHIQYYNHWENTTLPTIDFKAEYAKLFAHVQDYNEYCIFAKSAGTVLALKGVKDKELKPHQCFFTGVPLGFARRHNLPIEELLEGYSIPTLFMQKTHDPAAPFAALEDLVEENNVENYKLVEIEGDTHHYGDVENLQKEIEEFLNEK